ncbi:MAG: hypothetical protein KF687_15750 [Cyclobacteriaceae bacterium]|nr:hypothetical protein [Cyclobacteriaceae bacterium]
MKTKIGFTDPVLAFPIVVYFKTGVSVTFLNQDTFTKCYKKSFKSGEYLNATVVDSEGWKYVINDVQMLGYTNVFRGLDFFLGSRIFVKVILKKLELLSLENFKRAAIKLVKENSDSYLSAGLSLTSEVRKIKEASSIREITNILLP